MTAKEPPDPPNETRISFVERNGAYWELINNPSLRPQSDQYDGATLLTRGDPATWKTLGQLSENLFGFDIKLAKLAGQPDRSLRNLLPWRRPFTHADIIEADIDEKFPDDKKYRLLIRAWTKVIEQNQWRHIRIKRLYQVGYSALIFLVLLAVVIVGDQVVAGTMSALGLTRFGDTLKWAAWAALFSLVAVALTIAATFFLNRDLGNTTARFKSANQTSCSRLIKSMTAFSSRVSRRFGLLLNSIPTDGESNDAKDKGWSQKAKDVFKIAMWEAKRIESMEIFWQAEFERLRIFELVSDRVGNLSSYGLVVLVISGEAVALTLTTMATGQSLIEPIACFLVSAPIAWYFGALSRQPTLSFGMSDIIQEVDPPSDQTQSPGKAASAADGVEHWQPFSTVQYYEGLANTFKWGCDAKVTLNNKD